MENQDLWLQLQARLVAPKGQFNSFGKYKYRSTEDILEAVKPLLAELGLTILLDDEVVMIGGRYYVKCAASIMRNGMAIATAFGWAREAEEKKGMDSAQVTGSTSSYARKYALAGLLAIDDNKDADAAQYLDGDKKPLPAKPAEVPYTIGKMDQKVQEKPKEPQYQGLNATEKVDPGADLVAKPGVETPAPSAPAAKDGKETILCPKKGTNVYRGTCQKCSHLPGCPALDGQTLNLFNSVLPGGEVVATGERYVITDGEKSELSEFHALANSYFDKTGKGSAKMLDAHIENLKKVDRFKGLTANEIKVTIFKQGEFEKLWRAFTSKMKK